MAERVGSWCGLAFGLMGEQGAESIHNWFNRKGHKFVNMSDMSDMCDSVEKLHSKMKNHYKCCSTEHITKTSPHKRSDHFLIKNCLQTNAHIYYRKS